MSTSAEKASFIVNPPRVTGSAGVTLTKHSITSVVTGAAAVVTSLWGTLGASLTPKGKVWVEFEALTTPAYIVIRPNNTGGAGVTTTTGMLIPAGEQRRLWINPISDLYVDHISSGAGVLKWRVCSPEYDALVSTPA